MANSVDPDQTAPIVDTVSVCFNTKSVSNVRQSFAADDSSRQHLQMHFFSVRALRLIFLMYHTY